MNDYKVYSTEDLKDCMMVINRLRTIADYDYYSLEKVMKFLHFPDEKSHCIKNGIFRIYDIIYDLYECKKAVYNDAKRADFFDIAEKLHFISECDAIRFELLKAVLGLTDYDEVKLSNAIEVMYGLTE